MPKECIVIPMEAMDDGRPSFPDPPFTLLRRRRLQRSEVLAQDLVEHITEGRLPAGSMLPRERELTEQLGVGRATLREALRILETRRVLTVRSEPGSGPVVRHPEPSDLTE